MHLFTSTKFLRLSALLLTVLCCSAAPRPRSQVPEVVPALDEGRNSEVPKPGSTSDERYNLINPHDVVKRSEKHHHHHHGHHSHSRESHKDDFSFQQLWKGGAELGSHEDNDGHDGPQSEEEDSRNVSRQHRRHRKRDYFYDGEERSIKNDVDIGIDYNNDNYYGDNYDEGRLNNDVGVEIDYNNYNGNGDNYDEGSLQNDIYIETDYNNNNDNGDNNNKRSIQNNIDIDYNNDNGNGDDDKGSLKNDVDIKVDYNKGDDDKGSSKNDVDVDINYNNENININNDNKRSIKNDIKIDYNNDNANNNDDDNDDDDEVYEFYEAVDENRDMDEQKLVAGIRSLIPRGRALGFLQRLAIEAFLSSETQTKEALKCVLLQPCQVPAVFSSMLAEQGLSVLLHGKCHPPDSCSANTEELALTFRSLVAKHHPQLYKDTIALLLAMEAAGKSVVL